MPPLYHRENIEKKPLAVTHRFNSDPSSGVFIIIGHGQIPQAAFYAAFCIDE